MTYEVKDFKVIGDVTIQILKPHIDDEIVKVITPEGTFYINSRCTDCEMVVLNFSDFEKETT